MKSGCNTKKKAKKSYWLIYRRGVSLEGRFAGGGGQ